TVISKVRAADAKEVGVGNPAEETYYRPNQIRADARFSFLRCQSSYHNDFRANFCSKFLAFSCLKPAELGPLTFLFPFWKDSPMKARLFSTTLLLYIFSAGATPIFEPF